MQSQDFIHIGATDGYQWVRIEGKGDVFISPLLKKFAESCHDNGQDKLVIDLEECTQMDSTFMGALAGIATRALRKPDGNLELTGVSDRNIDSLEELGLDSLMDINPVDAVWADKTDNIRKCLISWDGKKEKPSAELILECHQNLSDIKEENKEKFTDVINTFKQQAE